MIGPSPCLFGHYAAGQKLHKPTPPLSDTIPDAGGNASGGALLFN